MKKNIILIAAAAILSSCKTLTLSDGAVDILMRGAKTATQVDAYEDAVHSYSRILFQYPDDDEVRLKRALIYYRTSYMQNAVDDISYLLKKNPDDKTLLLNRALVLTDMADYDAALRDVEKILQDNDRDAAAIELNEELQMLRNRDVKIISGYNATLSENPDDPIALYKRGMFFFNSDDTEMAISDLTKCISLSDDAVMVKDAYTALGDISAGKNAYDNALVYYKKASMLQKSDAELYKRIGYMHYCKADYETAIAYYNRAIKIIKKSDFLYGRGLCYYALGRYKKALSDFNACIFNYDISFNFCNFEFYEIRALTYDKMGNNDSARIEYYNAARYKR
jgi:tetratricopeptide repeat protein